MAEKFYEIFPPEFQKEESFEKIPLYQEKKLKKPSIFFLKLFFLVFFLISAGVFLSLRFSSLDLELYPEVETVVKKEEVSAVVGASEINFLDKIIPGHLFEEEKEIWQEFPASGRQLREEKAKGKIRVFNKSKKALSLIKETRFLSENDKTFISPKPIFIPANSYRDVEVVAIEAGEGYNIGPSNFSVPGLRGSDCYFTTSGKSFEPMKGGFKEEIKKVTEEDLEKAKKSLREKVFLSLQNSLKEKVSPQFILFDEAISKEIVEVFSPVKAGAEIERFGFSLKGKAKAMVFRKSDLENFLQELLLLELDSSKKFFPKSLSISYELESVDFKNNRIEMKVKISAKVYQAIDEDLIKNKILRKKENEIKEVILENIPRVSLKMKFHPFWLKRAPADPKRIKIYWKES